MRVAALLPAATDIVLALGGADRLVAATHACRLPTYLSRIPRITRSRVATGSAAAVDAQVTDLAAAGAPLFELDEHALAASRPDVILTQAVCDVCAVREADVRVAAARLDPPPGIVTLGAATVDGVLGDVGAVGQAIGLPGEADELMAGLKARVGSIHSRLKSARAPRPRVLVLEWTDPPFSAGHWIPDMVHRAGGEDVIGKRGEVSRRLSLTEWHESRPDVLIVAPCGLALADAVPQAGAMLDRPEWAWTREVPAWALDADRIASSPGTNVVRGIEVLARILHPALFGPPDERDAVRVA